MYRILQTYPSYSSPPPAGLTPVAMAPNALMKAQKNGLQVQHNTWWAER